MNLLHEKGYVYGCIGSDEGEDEHRSPSAVRVFVMTHPSPLSRPGVEFG